MFSKESIKKEIIHEILAKIKILDQELQSLQISMLNETKSSMGDKYETGRAMIQNEMAQLLKQKELLHQQFKQAENLAAPVSKKIQMGSLFEFNSLYFFISPYPCNLQINSQNIHCITPFSPLGKLVIGKDSKAKISYSFPQTIKKEFSITIIE